MKLTMQKHSQSGKVYPKTWTQAYPQGTREGNEEQAFFIAIARHPKYEWRSTAMIVKESGLSKTRVEEIIQKYVKMGLVFASPTREDHWAYWERVPEMLPCDDGTVAESDQDERIDQHIEEDGETDGD